MNFHRFLADLIAVVHFAWVAFVVLGLILILVGLALRWRWVRNFWFRMVHLLMIGIVVVEALGGVICPLTTWERDLRELGGEEGAPGRSSGGWSIDCCSSTGRSGCFECCTVRSERRFS